MTAPPERQLPLLDGDNDTKRPPTREKVYREGFRVRVTVSGILIEAIDYHTKPLLLQEEALRELGLMLLGDDSTPGSD